MTISGVDRADFIAMKTITIVRKKLGTVHEVLVDDEDYEFVKKWKWCVMKGSTNSGFYVMRKDCSTAKYKNVWLHRELMKPQTGEVVDHINRNPLDNRKENLRIVNRKKNMENQKLSRKNTSGVKGVYWNKQASKWQAYIRHNQKQINLGVYNTIEEAAQARKNKEQELSWHTNKPAFLGEM